MLISLLGGSTSNILTLIGIVLVASLLLLLLATAARWLKGKPWIRKSPMENVADELRRVVDGAAQELTGITDAESSLHPAEGKWSKKEILGHLIDSASNNHQRFVRAQLSAEIRLPAYEQSAWVKTQAYENEPWDALLVFWKSYNAHLVHVLASMPPEIKDHYCFIGEGQPVTVGQLAKDYLQHVRHHLEQLTA